MKFLITAAGAAVLHEAPPTAPDTSFPNPADWLLDRFADGGRITADWIVNKILDRIGELIVYVGHVLNENSAEIITFSIVICALGMMFAPLIGSSSNKWFGRAVGAFWVGVIWRVVSP